MMNISVCLATYNGEKYIREQMSSILKQLRPGDEVIVVDDCSKDETLQVIKDLKDPRIKIFTNERNGGDVFTFARAISLANNELIFMSDQDDIWIDGRLELMMTGFLEPGTLLVSSNTDFIDMNGEIIKYDVKKLRRIDSKRHLLNIISIFTGKTGYYGCAMAFRKELSEIILPVPHYVESHDLWVALAGNILHSNTHLDENTLHRRIHDKNASILRRSFFLKIMSKIIHFRSLIDLMIRSRKFSQKMKLKNK